MVPSRAARPAGEFQEILSIIRQLAVERSRRYALLREEVCAGCPLLAGGRDGRALASGDLSPERP